jgi:2-hydroxychromene-2-carboxylate isomerase
VAEPEFFYDFNSPFAYLGASRVDEVLPVRPRWRPIAFGVIVRQTGKRPWSFNEVTRGGVIDQIAARAADRGLPPVRYPTGWPVESYSLAPLRAAVVAEDAGRLREFSHEMFRAVFVEGRPGNDLDAVLDAAQRAGLEPDAVRAGLESQDVKDRVRAATDEALARGIDGVPTVAVGDELFWGDDRLEDAAAALGQAA